LLKTIALVNPLWDGHHPTYFYYFTKTLLELGNRVLAFCSAPTELRKMVLNDLNCDDRFQVFKLPELQDSRFFGKGFRSTLIAIKRWKLANTAIKQAGATIKLTPDLVFFGALDIYLPPYFLTPIIIDRIFPYDWSGLYFQPRHLRIKQKFASIRQGCFTPHSALQASRCKSVAVLDEGVAESLKNKIQKPVITFPDIADASKPDPEFELVQEIKIQARSRKIVGLLGSLSKRKNLLMLLDVAKQVPDSQYFFIFIGTLDRSTFSPEELIKIENIVNSKPTNCFFYFNRIPKECQFNALISACDILFAVYKNFSASSNFLTKSALFKKPIIVSQNYCMGERVKNFNLGVCIQEDSKSQCIKALNEVCNTSSLEAKFEEYAKLHSLQRLYLDFSEILKS
jgi:glycosyltransferase involved in cell wall biosynthesis